jgi:hypothetical protein
VKVRDNEGLANRIDPKPCVGIREGVRRSVDRGECRPSNEPRKAVSLERRHPGERWKAIRLRAQTRVRKRLCVGVDLGMYRSSVHGNREVFDSAAMYMAARIGKAMSRTR